MVMPVPPASVMTASVVAGALLGNPPNVQVPAVQVVVPAYEAPDTPVSEMVPAFMTMSLTARMGLASDSVQMMAPPVRMVPVKVALVWSNTSVLVDTPKAKLPPLLVSIRTVAVVLLPSVAVSVPVNAPDPPKFSVEVDCMVMGLLDGALSSRVAVTPGVTST
jgi:hypothetical protein